MLHEIEEFISPCPKLKNGRDSCFGKPQDKCADTQEKLDASRKVICYHCGKAFSKEVTNYQARMEEYGYEVGREYITDILMREEEHWLDGFLRDINIPDKIDQALKAMTANMAKMRMVTDNMEDLEEEEEEEEELDPEDIDDPTLKKRAEKEKKLQARFESDIKRLRLDVEDAHFSKPICSKCAEQRKMLQSKKVIFANQPLRTREWQCPDQNALVTIVGGEEIYVSQKLIKARTKPEDWVFEARTNFRKGWKGVAEMVEAKYDAMQKAMSVVNIVDPVVLHAADPWIIKKLTKADRGLIEANPEEAKMKPGRNAMTHIHGGRCVIEFVLYMDCVLYRYY
jgi:hypothetical protein